MGTRLPRNEPGNNCPVCFGPGKAFGDVVTPHVMQMRLTSLLPGEHWDDAYELTLLTTHWLEQTAQPCLWEIFDAPLRWRLEWHPAITIVSVRDLVTLKFAFVSSQPPICAVDVPSDIIDPVGNIAWNGFANFTWDEEGL